LVFLAQLNAAAARHAAPDPVFAAWHLLSRSFVDCMLSHDLGGAISNVREADSLVKVAGDSVVRGLALVMRAAVHNECGAFDRVEASLRSAIGGKGIATQLGAYWRVHLGHGLLNAKRVAELPGLLESVMRGTDQVVASMAEAELAGSYVVGGKLDEAETIARPLAETHFAFTRGAALVILQQVAMARGQWEEALRLGERGLKMTTRVINPLTESHLRVGRALALHALGREEDARAAIRTARDRILKIASTLHEPDLREAYLHNLEPHVRTLELAREWLGEEEHSRA
jgi:hypothetical protein